MAVLVLMLFSLTGCDGPGEPAGESAASDTDGSGIPAPGSSTHSGWSQIVLPEPTTAPATAAATTVPVQVADPGSERLRSLILRSRRRRTSPSARV